MAIHFFSQSETHPAATAPGRTGSAGIERIRAELRTDALVARPMKMWR